MLGGWAVKQTKQSQHKRCHMCQIPRFNSRLLSLLLILGAILRAQHASGAYLILRLKTKLRSPGPTDRTQPVCNFSPTPPPAAPPQRPFHTLATHTATSD